MPTRNDHPAMLLDLVGVIGPDHMIIVHTTTPDISPDIDGCINLRHEGELNIQAWWKTGIRAAGTRYVALINDDVGLKFNIIPLMVGACRDSGRSLARVVGPNVPRKSGFLFVIDTDHGLMPDTGFRWWWGDDDLYHQAEQRHGIVEIPAEGVEHADDSNYHLNPAFTDIITADKEYYRQKWYPNESWG